MRLLALLFALVLASLAFAQDESAPVLVLLQPARASGIEADDYHKGWWVRWPVAMPGRNNRLWSLLSGQDWLGMEGAYTFKPSGDGRWTYPFHRDLIVKGYFDAVGSVMMRGEPTVISGSGGVSLNALFLGLELKTADVRVSPPQSGWSRLAIFEARSWNDIAAIRKQTVGRVLVVEYPPPANVRWSRLWPLGDWPKHNPLTDDFDKPIDELGVPGLINAKNVGALVLSGQRFQWSTEEQRENPARWMKAMSGPGLWLLGIWGVLATAVFVLAARFVTIERRSVWLGIAVEAVLISPAAAVVAGNLSRVAGVDTMPILFPVVLFALWLAALVVRRFAHDAHPLWSLSLVGLASMLLLSPTWSLLGSTFNPQPEPGPPEAYGVLIAYLIGVSALLPELMRLRTLVYLSLFAIPIWGFVSQKWWAHLGWAALLLPMLGWELVGERIRKQTPIVWGVLAAALAIYAGFCVAPFELLDNFNDAGKINAFVYYRFLASPTLLATLTLTGLLALFGDKFFLYWMRKLIKADRRRMVLLTFSLCTFAIGLSHPWLLFAALFVFLGGLGLLLRDALVAEELVLGQ